jgi:hypothetical protein
MGVVLGIAGAVVLAVVSFLAWRWFRFAGASRGSGDALLAKLDPVMFALKAGEQPPTETVCSLAADPLTRSLLYRNLRCISRADVFPDDQSSLDLIAESDLARWLSHPYELGVVPRRMELAETFQRSEGEPPESYQFYVFRFLGGQEDDTWYAGVAGPYWECDAGDQDPPCVFSQLEPFDKCPPEEHLRKTEELILKKLG